LIARALRALQPSRRESRSPTEGRRESGEPSIASKRAAPVARLTRGPSSAICFPMSAQRPGAAAVESAPCEANADLSGLRVLVVDDEQDARDLIQYVLEECHAEVEVASSAAEGFALFQGRRPNVLVSDIAMP
jgi:PleD family two-component response regulator